MCMCLCLPHKIRKVVQFAYFCVDSFAVCLFTVSGRAVDVIFLLWCVVDNMFQVCTRTAYNFNV